MTIEEMEAAALEIKTETVAKANTAERVGTLFEGIVGHLSTPLKYKCLLSQNAPIPTQTSGTVIVGQIWTIETFEAGDDFSNWELISGTANTAGAKYRALTTTPTTWSNGSDLSYDGAPYIVSTDSNGYFAPFINTLGEDPTLNYDSTGFVYLDKTGGFDLDKTFPNIGTSYRQGSVDMTFKTYVYTDNKIWIDTYSNILGVNTSADAGLYYTPFEFEINP